MLKYDDLKKRSANGIPAYEALIPVVMDVILEKNVWMSKELRKTVADSIGMPNNLRNLWYDSGNGNIIENRVDWAISDLKVAGLVNYPKRGMCEITDLGRKLREQYGNNLTLAIIKTQPKFIEHQQNLKDRKLRDGNGADLADADGSPEEIILSNVKNYNHEIAIRLLEKILNADPVFFENLVVKLLVAMGYKGTHGTAIATQASKDGGIDGIINQDPLGTSTVYIQAKRYQAGSNIQRQDIEGFYGALKRIHADRGVFITTSGFSKTAEETAKGFSIVLIDGIKLTDLMLQYNVGVRVKETYTLYDIDEEFFEID